MGFVSYQVDKPHLGVALPLVKVFSAWSDTKPGMNLSLEDWICPTLLWSLEAWETENLFLGGQKESKCIAASSCG